MGETPSNREELEAELTRRATPRLGWVARGEIHSILGDIEALGLRIVPSDPTEEMIDEFDWLTKEAGCGVHESLIEAIAKSPFAPEEQTQ